MLYKYDAERTSRGHPPPTRRKASVGRKVGIGRKTGRDDEVPGQRPMGLHRAALCDLERGARARA